MSKIKFIMRQPVVAAATNIVLLLFLYTLSRLFYYCINLDLYPGVSGRHLCEMLLGGMRFDLTAVLYLSSVYLLLMLLPLPAQWRNHRAYTAMARAFFFLPNAVGIVMNCGDMIYTRFSDRRTTADVFTEFAHDSNIPKILAQNMLQHWQVTLFGLVLLLLLWFAYRRPQAHVPQTDVRNQVRYYLRHLLLMLIGAYFTVIGIRSGFGAFTRPINMSNAMQYADEAREANIVLNTPFCILRTLGEETYSDPGYYTTEELHTLMTPDRQPQDTTSMHPMNVMIFILESCCTEHWGFFNHHLDNGTYQGFTPFLDSLASRSVTYRYSYASGRKSIDAMPSILSSIPMLIKPYILTHYSTNRVSGVADALRQNGYQTAFFHNAPNGSMGFLGYSRSCGYQQYFGMTEYDNGNDYDGTWGIWDEPFLQFVCQQLGTLKEPFLATEFTTSSHDPFVVPAQYDDSLPKGQQPICHCVAYTDMAMRRFFQQASKQPWFKNTLFVITADHTNQLYHPEYTNDRGLYAVPILFYAPGHLEVRLDTTTAISQTDIMPSVLAYLGYNKPYFAFGEDALTQPKQHNYAICYNHPYYQIMSPHGLLQFDGQKVVKSEGLTPTEENEMQTYLKAYIQQYITRIITNKLTCE